MYLCFFSPSSLITGDRWRMGCKYRKLHRRCVRCTIIHSEHKKSLTSFFPDHSDTPESTATVTSPATSTFVSTAIITRTVNIGQSIQSSPSASASATASPAPTSGSHTGAIAGGVVGGVLALIGIGAFAIYLRRRRRRDVQMFNNSEAQMAAVPNNAAGPTTPMFEPLLRDHGHGSSGGSQAHMSQSATTMRYYVRPSKSSSLDHPLTLNNSVTFISEPI